MRLLCKLGWHDWHVPSNIREDRPEIPPQFKLINCQFLIIADLICCKCRKKVKVLQQEGKKRWKRI